jgi:hypothetical protein
MGLVFQRRLLAPQRISGSYRPFDYIFGILKMQSKNRDAHPHVGQRAKVLGSVSNSFPDAPYRATWR